MNLRFSLRALLVSLFFGSLCFAKNKSSDQEGADLLVKAASLQNIHQQGGEPFQLRMRIHAEHIVSKPMDGEYAEIWIAPDKWRREIVSPGFTQLEIGDANSRWLTRNLEFRPRVIYLTEVAIDNFVRPQMLQGEVIKSVRNRKITGIETRCVQMLEKGTDRSRESCFDTSGVLVGEFAVDQRFEYGDFGKLGSRVFPKSIRVYEGNSRVVQISADLTPGPESRAELFQHGATARQIAPCERRPVSPEKKVAPQYPPSARAAHERGTVILYVLLSDKGAVEKTFVLQSAGSNLDQSAIEAVTQWMYAPITCGAVPLETEIELSVNYELRIE